MKEITVDYNPETGELTHPLTGAHIAYQPELKGCEKKEDNFERVLKLVNAGLTSEEIIELRRKGLL